MKSKIISLLLLFCMNVSAQMHWQRPIVNFTRKEYNASGQNWKIAQHQNGWLYFANSKGLLEYDGAFWNLYPLGHGSKMTSILMGKNCIYAGGLRQFGFFKPNSTGGLTYTSLSEKLTTQKAPNIWNILPLGKSIYYQGDVKFFKYSNGQVKAIDCAGIAYSVVYNGKIYFANYKGLSCIQNDRVFNVINSRNLDGNDVASLLVYKKKLLIVKTNGQVYEFDGRKMTHLSDKIKEAVDGHKVSCMAISNGIIAVGTVDNGLYLFNSIYNNVEHIGILTGLQDRSIRSLHFDVDNNLWVALENGISYIPLNNSLFFLRGNLENIGGGYCESIFNGQLYLGTNQGVFHTSLPNLANNKAVVNQLPGMPGQTHCLTTIDGSLFCGGRDFFSILGERVNNIYIKRGVWNANPIGNNEDGNVLLGTYWGLHLAHKTALGWVVSKKIQGFDMSAKTVFVEPESNSVWVANKTDGLWRITLDNRLTKVLRKKCYNSHKLPKGDNVCVAEIDRNIVIASREGLFRYDPTNDVLRPFNELEKKLDGHKAYSYIWQDTNGYIWYAANGMLSMKSPYGNGGETFLTDNLIQDFEKVTPINGRQAIAGTEEGFVLIDGRGKKLRSVPFVQIRRLYSTSGKDSIIYGRSFCYSDKPIKIDYANNSIRIEYAAGCNDPLQVVSYSCRLVGEDKTWSEYSTSTSKEYTGLKEGKYTFEVKARTGVGTESGIVKLQFKVLPPWYRSWWAYCLYVIALALLVYRARKKYIKSKEELIRQKELEISRQKEIYNKDIGEKTKQIDEKEKQIGKLEDEKLRAELQYKSDELVKSTLNVVRKNEMLQKIRKEAENLSRDADSGDKVSLRRSILRLISQIDVNLEHDTDLKNFESSFDSVHHDFFKKLEAINPELTHKDKVLCAYIRMNLMSKEIAPLLNISVRGVEISRYRLRKKLGLDEKDNLAEFLQKM